MRAENSGDSDKMLKMHMAIEAEAALDLGDYLRGALEGIVDVMAGLEVAGVVGELAASELGDFVELGTFCFEFLGNGSDEVIDGAF